MIPLFVSSGTGCGGGHFHLRAPFPFYGRQIGAHTATCIHWLCDFVLLQVLTGYSTDI